MTPEEWQRVRPILESALELEPESRASYLSGTCPDPSLRREVESLIASHEQADSKVLNPGSPLSLNPDEETRFRLPQGKHIGAYEILEEIAVGGMGAVYRAVRADGQYKQEVALKVVRPELGTELTASRFKKERQILASLNHPNIAKILEGGTTTEGVPYFVMELIEGQRLDKYCDAHKLATTERLKLILQVCSAVQYAHQRLIIHRDIKPGNILVTADGIPMLLDFGIAKILESSEVSDQPEQTISLLRLLTPEYASPEQVKGEAITTASDVYSLGVVLYELLTGRTPYNVLTRTTQEMFRAVCETEPEKPSTAVRRRQIATGDGEGKRANDSARSVAREGSPEKLSKRLRGDLDNIVLMALRKESQRRYASVEQFAQDIQRHLDRLPVVARKGTFIYRASKFVTRHKAGVTAAIVIAIALTAGMLATLREARIAERRFNDVRQLANSLMFEVHDSIKDLAGATPARKLVVSKALQYLDSLSQEAAGDTSLQRELAAAYEKVGHVQGDPYTANLGDTAGALASYRKALAIRASLAATSGNSEESQRDLANDYEWVGQALETLGDYRSALEYYRKDFAIDEHFSRSSATAESQERLAGAYFLMAHCYTALQDPNHALENYRKSAAIRESMATGSPPFVRSRLAGTYSFMAGIIWVQGDPGQAAQLQRKSLAILRELADDDPTNATFREFRDEAYYWLGYFLEKSRDFAQALVNYRRALKDFEALGSVDPKEVRARQYVAICYKSIGTALVEEGDVAHGLQSIRKALSIFEKLPVPENADNVADAYAALGFAYSRLAVQRGSSTPARTANFTEAHAAYQKSLDHWLELKNRGALTVFTAGEPDRIKSELARCDAALAQLTAPTQ